MNGGRKVGSRRAERAWAPLVAMAAAGAAIAHGFRKFGTWADIPERFEGSDSYTLIAEAWANGGVLDNARPPAYPFILGTLARLFGQDAYPYAVLLLQALLFVGVVLMVFVLGGRAGGSRGWGLVPALLVLLNWHLVDEFLDKRETFLYASLLLLTFYLIETRAHTRYAGAGFLGLLCACGWLTRPTGFLLAPIVMLVWLIDQRRLRGAKLRAQAIVFLALFLAPITVWTGYQSLHGSRVAISGASTALNLYKGNNEALAAIYPYIDLDKLEPYIHEKEALWRQLGLGADEQLTREAVRFAAGSPLRALALAPRKVAAFFLPGHFPLGTGRPRHATGDGWILEDYRPLHWLNQVVGLTALPGVLLCFLAAWRLRDMPPPVLFTCAVVLVTALLHVVTFAETRFRLPFDPVLAVSVVPTIRAVRPGWLRPPNQVKGEAPPLDGW